MTIKLLRLREGPMGASGIEHVPFVEEESQVPMEELVRRVDKPPMTYRDAVAAGPGGFDTDEELDEFLVWYRAERQRFMG